MALQIRGNCTRCGDCVQVCPNGAVRAGNPYRIATLLCTECVGYSTDPVCVAVCPAGAIGPAVLDIPAARGFVMAPLKAALCLVVLASGLLRAQDPSDFFAQNCASCHTIGGGRLTGPDLKDVEARKDRAWLSQFVANPKAAFERGDPYAMKLREEARGVEMPVVAGMTPAIAERLLELIAAESRLPKSRFAGVQISDRPFTPRDIAEGRRLFGGDKRLASGAPPCISCHSITGLAGLGGGGLAPDLTKVYERLGGRKGLGNWLAAPATPTMQALFRRTPVQPEEILPLLATLEQSARTPQQANTAAQTIFLLLGLAGAVCALVVFDTVWKQRFRSVRRAMVDAAKAHSK